MKLAVVNDIHIGKCLEHNGKIRASSHLIEDMLPGFFQKIIEQHSPDALINLGDLIRSEERESDLQKYRRLIANFLSIKLPVIHLLGNHELKKMHLKDIESAWNEQGFNQKSYGSIDINDFTLIWLGLELDPNDHRLRFLPSDQMDWLKKQLAEVNRPTVIFTHCPIDDHDVNGNFFYEACDKRNKTTLFLENQEEIRKIISSSGSVIAVLQAHLHYFHMKKIDAIPYITCPAMGDNICGMNIEDNVPEIYTILSFEKNRITAKAFSQKYCFAGYEGNFKN